jgi:NAD(P)-dependent dehydrogenase (short-subunit alcohol dehydrogenase family)
VPTDPNPAQLVLAGRSALVTGGGSGIGLACAEALLADGCSVTLMGRSQDRLEGATAKLRDLAPAGAEVAWSSGDVSVEADVEAAVARAVEVGGGLHVAVASAGTGTVAPIVAQTLDDFERVFDTNVIGTFLTIKHAARAMVAGGRGSIVAISSLAGVTVHRYMSTYGASKAAIDMLVRNSADELGADGVRVNSVQPSLIETELMELPMQDEALIASYLANQPVARIGTVGDVATVVRFLCGPESGWVTGNALPIDGGHHLRCGPDYGGLARMLYGETATEPGFTG